MKTRIGFVSNSSSSSFIVGIGVVTDFKKFNDWMGKLPEDVAEDINLYDPTEEVKRSWADDITEDSTSYSTEEPTNYGGTLYINKEDYNKLKTERPDNIVVMCIGNNEGNSAFRYDDNRDDLDYDIDLDWFTESQQNAYNGFGKDNGIDLAEVTYGAGRNG